MIYRHSFLRKRLLQVFFSEAVMATSFSLPPDWNTEMSEEDLVQWLEREYQEHRRQMKEMREEDERKEKEHRRRMKELDEEKRIESNVATPLQITKVSIPSPPTQ